MKIRQRLIFINYLIQFWKIIQNTEKRHNVMNCWYVSNLDTLNVVNKKGEEKMNSERREAIDILQYHPTGHEVDFDIPVVAKMDNDILEGSSKTNKMSEMERKNLISTVKGMSDDQIDIFLDNIPIQKVYARLGKELERTEKILTAVAEVSDML